jgi:hypothetical protein
MKTTACWRAVWTAMLWIGTAAAVAMAATPEATTPAPPEPWVGPGAARPPVPPPRIGFRYILIPGYGYKIVEVMPFSAAARMCLDYGDVILTLNGCPMTHHGADLPVRARAVATDGWVTAYIHDEHTGLLVTRSANLFGPPRRPPPPPRDPGLATPGAALPPPGAASPPAPVVEQPLPGADQPPGDQAKPKPDDTGQESPDRMPVGRRT